MNTAAILEILQFSNDGKRKISLFDRNLGRKSAKFSAQAMTVIILCFPGYDMQGEWSGNSGQEMKHLRVDFNNTCL